MKYTQKFHDYLAPKVYRNPLFFSIKTKNIKKGGLGAASWKNHKYSILW